MTYPRTIAMGAGERMAEIVQSQQVDVETLQRNMAQQPQRVWAGNATATGDLGSMTAATSHSWSHRSVYWAQGMLIGVFYETEMYQTQINSGLGAQVFDENNPGSFNPLTHMVTVNNSTVGSWFSASSYPRASLDSYTSFSVGGMIIIGTQRLIDTGGLPNREVKLGIRFVTVKTGVQLRNQNFHAWVL